MKIYPYKQQANLKGKMLITNLKNNGISQKKSPARLNTREEGLEKGLLLQFVFESRFSLDCSVDSAFSRSYNHLQIICSVHSRFLSSLREAIK